MLYPNCSEATYKIPGSGMAKGLEIVKKLIMDKRVIIDIGELKVIAPKYGFYKKDGEFVDRKIEEFDKLRWEIQKIMLPDTTYEGKLTIDDLKKLYGIFGLEEIRPKIYEIFEQLVLLGEKYRKKIIEVSKEDAKLEGEPLDPENIHSYYVILDVRWYPMDYIADSNIKMKFGEGTRDWVTELDFESHGAEREVDDAVKQVGKFITKLKYVDSS